MIVLAPGLTTVLVDIVCWAGLTALAQGVMRLVAGTAADRLASRPWERANPSAANVTMDVNPRRRDDGG
jgi:hypothetical protein